VADTIRLDAAAYGVNTQLALSTPIAIVGASAASTTVRSAG
jgi:hypothetical protein